jgi:hypothetical protein
MMPTEHAVRKALVKLKAADGRQRRLSCSREGLERAWLNGLDDVQQPNNS